MDEPVQFLLDLALLKTLFTEGGSSLRSIIEKPFDLEDYKFKTKKKETVFISDG